MTPVYYKTMYSPIGELTLFASDSTLLEVIFPLSRRVRTGKNAMCEHHDRHPLLVKAQSQLEEYFAGKRKHFDLSLAIKGSVFQIKAWKELQKIPYGETISYGEQARRLGDTKKARAVGMANGRNPLSIVVPCHRVIGASGALTGFGGGIKAKQYLLDLEKRAVSL